MTPVWRYFNEMESRVPMADWYSTKTAKYFLHDAPLGAGRLFSSACLRRKAPAVSEKGEKRWI